MDAETAHEYLPLIVEHMHTFTYYHLKYTCNRTVIDVCRLTRTWEMDDIMSISDELTEFWADAYAEHVLEEQDYENALEDMYQEYVRGL